MAGKGKRKDPKTTTQYIIGLIAASVYVENYANESVDSDYYSGILSSAFLLTAHAAELALKLAYENENPDKTALQVHYLDELYGELATSRRLDIETEYSMRIGLHESTPIPGWQSAEEVFSSGREYPVELRFLTEEGQSPFEIHPNFLREAVCSVLGSLGTKVKMSPAFSGEQNKVTQS